jgi:hypothetical protein
MIAFWHLLPLQLLHAFNHLNLGEAQLVTLYAWACLRTCVHTTLAAVAGTLRLPLLELLGCRC